MKVFIDSIVSNGYAEVSGLFKIIDSSPSYNLSRSSRTLPVIVSTFIFVGC